MERRELTVGRLAAALALTSAGRYRTFEQISEDAANICGLGPLLAESPMARILAGKKLAPYAGELCEHPVTGGLAVRLGSRYCELVRAPDFEDAN